MKKNIFTFEIVVLLLYLTGCASLEDRVGQKMLEQSGIMDSESYVKYNRYAESGILDSEGYYSYDNAEAVHDGDIRVTFSENSNLSITYYFDADQTIPVDIHSCYLNPGDSIYANVELKRGISELYVFQGFNIYEIEDGKMYLTDLLKGDFLSNYQVLSIPTDYDIKELSIIPIGAYETKTIFLNDYYVDDLDQEHSLDGMWSFNNQQCSENVISINPITPYTVSYKYDSSKYFYLRSTPETYFVDNNQGMVIFKQRQPFDELVDYSVGLHEYLSVSVRADVDRSVKVNDDDQVYLKANESYVISGLMYGSNVSIITNREWPELENSRDMILSETPRQISQYEWKYSFTIPQPGSGFFFNPSEYTYEHGTIAFTCFGETVTGGMYLAPGSRIYYSQVSADKDYWLSDSENYIVVSDEETTRQALNNIHFTEMLSTELKLPQPTAGGTIVYRREDGSQIYGTTLNTYSGTVIVMDFKPWEGWINQFTNGIRYIVSEQKNQTITIEGELIDKAFVEDSGHKPNLTVVLEKSVGENMEFSFTASGLYKDDYHYESGWFRNDYKIIQDKIIGTDKPIEISMGNRAIPSGQAVRLIIEKKDINGKVYSETRYYDSLTNEISPIYIYTSYEASTSTIWYKSINIKIGVVNIDKVQDAPTISNATIALFDNDTNARISAGDLIEPDRKVIVTITPNSGYYVTGKNVTNDVYRDVMKYSDFIKKIDGIINDHQVVKLVQIILDSSDSFAKYTYKVDKKAVSGTIFVHDGAKLSLDYSITDSDHHLTESSGGFLGWGASDTEISKEITVTTSMDGTTITRSSFGIYVMGE